MSETSSLHRKSEPGTPVRGLDFEGVGGVVETPIAESSSVGTLTGLGEDFDSFGVSPYSLPPSPPKRVMGVGVGAGADIMGGGGGGGVEKEEEEEMQEVRLSVLLKDESDYLTYIYKVYN